MTVREMMERLQGMPPEAEVVRVASDFECMTARTPALEVVWHEDGKFLRTNATVEEFKTGMVTGELGLVVVLR